MRKLVKVLASAALLAVCITPTTLFAAETETAKTVEKVSNAVAEINGKEYATLAEAIQEVENDQTIKILDNMDLTGNIDVHDKAFILELNGKNINQVLNETIKNTAAPLRLYNSKLTVNDSVGTGSIFGHQCAVGVFINSKLILNNGTLKGSWYGISGNGSNQNGTEITINGGNVLNNDPDGTGAAIYHPQTGTITINGGIIRGDLGIQLCAGNLSVVSISGGVIEGTGKDERTSKTSDGAVPDGAAVSVVNRAGYSSVPSVTITGGVFKSTHSEGLLAYTWSKDTASEWLEAKDHVKVSGGTFDSDPSAFVEDNYRAFASDGNYTVAPLASKVTLSNTELTVEEGQSKTLVASLTPTDTLETVSWSSSDEKIATVKDGKVTAVAAGIATITAKTESGIKAECKVTVTKPVKVEELPSIDTSKPVEEVTVGISDEKAGEILKNVADQIVSGTKDFASTETIKAVADAVNNGESITVSTEVKEADTNKAEIKADAEKIQKELKTLVLEDKASASVAMYLDINVLIKTDTQVLGNVTELPKAVTFMIAIPEKLQAEGREFKVMRVHNGEVTMLDTTMNKDGSTLTFDTNLFSTYALVYVDKKAEEPTPTPDPKPEPTPNPDPTPNPQPTPEPETTVYNVVFVDMNGAVLKVEKVNANGAATAPVAPAVEGYRFVKWDTDFSKVTKDLLVKPVYEKVTATEKPTATPEKPSSDKNTPDTGDTTSAGLFTAFALLGLVSMGIIAVQRKRKQLMK